jgi:hypothetical protein
MVIQKWQRLVDPCLLVRPLFKECVDNLKKSKELKCLTVQIDGLAIKRQASCALGSLASGK